MSRPRREAELRAPLKAYFGARGYRVWADPDGADFLDLVVAREEEVGLVELKLSDWKTVRAQAVARRALADWVAVALPSQRLAEKLIGSLRGPIAPRVGVFRVDGPQVAELRAPVRLEPPSEGSIAAEARSGFRTLVKAALDGTVPPGLSWGAGARRTGRGRFYRLDEFPEPASAGDEVSPRGS